MKAPILVVDAFASEPFRGNPAAVCFPPEPADEDWMRAVAAEMNLAETAFLRPRGDEGWDLRWFTPTVEVDLCGHATLASAHALWETGRLKPGERARFLTRSGWLECDAIEGGVAMDFPARPAAAAPVPPGLVRALGAEVKWCGRSADDFLVELADATTLRALEPDLAAIATLPVRGVIVTAAGDVPGFDFISRFFAPASGVAEDPVTGSAHCTLAVFWADRLGRTSLRGWQASRRGGAVGMELRGSRVTLSGSAVTVWRGELA
jgi:predicted PhzF superfamily epimerase YddE/YHI9